MTRTRIAAALLAAVLAAGACSPTFSDEDTANSMRAGYVTRNGDRVSGTGTVEWFSLEGGFFALRGDDGKVYDPINLPATYRSAGMRVRFEAKIRSDVGSFHMVGEIVEVLQIGGA